MIETPEDIMAALLNPTPTDRAIAREAERIKKRSPERWRTLAREVFGLHSKHGAELLLPQAVAIRARKLNRRIGNRWCLLEDGSQLIRGT